MTFSKLYSSQQGVASVLVGLCMMVFLGFAALAVDLGLIYFKQSRLQTAADVAALAGANSLMAEGEDFNKLRAIATKYGIRNLTELDNPAVALTNADIIFMRDGVATELEPTQVEVTVTLSEERGNPLLLFFGKVVGVPSVNLSATARAGIVGMCSSKCIKPFVVPTKFEWDDQAAPGTKYYNNGELDTESVQELASVNVLGYNQDDIGTQIIIKPGDPQLSIVPGQYNLIDLPPVNKGSPVTGASAVQENIVGCTGSNSLFPVEPGDELQLEPGNSKGPVSTGVKTVLDMDPYAYWDSSTKSVEGSSFADPLDSPRVAIMAFYDPKQPPVSGRNSVIIYELGAFFLESLDSQGNVAARFMNTIAIDPVETSNPDCLLRISRVMLDSSRQ